jgi:hypothetical protein
MVMHNEMETTDEKDVVASVLRLRLPSGFLPVASLTYSEDKPVRPSETSVNFYQTTQRHIPEDGTNHSLRYNILKSNKYIWM